MKLPVSGCYYHPGELAVAVCAKCGVGICRECAVKNEQGTIICYQCGNEQLKKEHKEFRRMLKERGGRFSTWGDFIVPGIIGVLIDIAYLILVYVGYPDSSYDSISKVQIFLAHILLCYNLFSIPFIYIWTGDLFAPKYEGLRERMDRKLLRGGFAFTTGGLLGGVIFTIILIRFLIRKKQT